MQSNDPKDNPKPLHSSFESIESTPVLEPPTNLPHSSDSSSTVPRCLDCEQKFASQELENHLFTCPFARRKCNVDGCRFQGSNDEFLEHIRMDHAQDLLLAFTRNTFSNVNERPESIYDNDPITFKINGAGRKAWLGDNGKYYCNGKLNGDCYQGGVRGCCDGYCGPADGCNCRACMELDLKYRRLPKGYWVNRVGMKCTRGDDGRIYCGRKVFYQNRCEPEEGTQCSSCGALQFQLDGRYSGLG